MERITISVETELAQAFDALIAERGYRNRSEAMRDLLRAELERSRQSKDESEYCVASLSYVYNHHERELPSRLAERQHAHHDLVVSTLHAHLDHDHCMECSILRGPTQAVRQVAQTLMAESGVRHGQLNLISMTESSREHSHVLDPRTAHRHFRPVT